MTTIIFFIFVSSPGSASSVHSSESNWFSAFMDIASVRHRYAPSISLANALPQKQRGETLESFFGLNWLVELIVRDSKSMFSASVQSGRSCTSNRETPGRSFTSNRETRVGPLFFVSSRTYRRIPRLCSAYTFSLADAPLLERKRVRQTRVSMCIHLRNPSSCLETMYKACRTAGRKALFSIGWSMRLPVLLAAQQWWTPSVFSLKRSISGHSFFEGVQVKSLLAKE